MNQSNKHITSIVLMSTSIVLLLAFQLFWLQKVYHEQRNWLQKEADNLFHDAIATLQDSIIQSKFVLNASDTCQNIMTPGETSFQSVQRTEVSTLIFRNDSTNFRFISKASGFPERTKDSSKIKLMVTALDSNLLPQTEHWQSKGRFFPSDSIRSIYINRALRQVILNVNQSNGAEDVVIKLGEDSLEVADITHTFARKLQEAAIPVQFRLLKSTFSQEWNGDDSKLTVGPVPGGMPPRDLFAAELSGYRAYLFRKIVPQLFFSIFLVGITTLAFWLIYRSLRQQQRLAQLKNDFISNVTHELKTPIATVSVAIEALNNFNALQNPQLTREYLDISKNELNRLNILVDKVLKMAIFEQGEPELRPERFDFREMVRQIVASMKLQFEKYDAKVNFEAAGADFMMQGDVTHLTSVVYNLIDNALKYSKNEPKISILLEQQNGQLNLSVEDNGIGIAHEHQQRIFEKFYRVASGDVHNIKGHGLGLSYVANVVRKHGGSIDLSSEPGEGSRFVVHLPRTHHLSENG